MLSEFESGFDTKSDQSGTTLGTKNSTKELFVSKKEDLEFLVEKQAQIDSSATFSTNEELDEIDTDNLKYLLVSGWLGLAMT